MSRLHEEHGITLVEMLVGMILMAIVMSMAAAGTVAAMKTQRRQISAVDVMNRSKVAMERLTREIRAANPVMVAAPNSLTVQVTRGTVRKLTKYELVGPAGCPAPAYCAITSTVTTETLTTPVTVSTAPATNLLTGVQLNVGDVLFRYWDKDAVEITGAIDPGDVRTVKINLRSPVQESPRAVELNTEVLVRNSRV